MENRGLPGAVIFCARRVIFGRREVPLDIVHPFDQQFGTDTSGLLVANELGGQHPNAPHNSSYYGIAPSIFRELFRRWQSTLPPGDDPTRYTFVDIGSGKGRALLLASELPFREVIGVELDAGLSAAAEKNVARWQELGRTRSPIRVLTQDATEFTWPAGPTVIYLFNSFGLPVLERLIEQILASAQADPRPLDLLYVTPAHRSMLDSHPAFQQLWAKRLRMDPADRAADIFQSVSELCIAYRIKPQK